MLRIAAFASSVVASRPTVFSAAADLVERLRPVAEADGEPAAEVDPGTAPRGTVH